MAGRSAPMEVTLLQEARQTAQTEDSDGLFTFRRCCTPARHTIPLCLRMDKVRVSVCGVRL